MKTFTRVPQTSWSELSTKWHESVGNQNHKDFLVFSTAHENTILRVFLSRTNYTLFLAHLAVSTVSSKSCLNTYVQFKMVVHRSLLRQQRQPKTMKIRCTASMHVDHASFLLLGSLSKIPFSQSRILIPMGKSTLLFVAVDTPAPPIFKPMSCLC